jgi:PAS domain S-box-containing protein
LTSLTPIRNPWAQGLFGAVTVLLLALGAGVIYGWLAQVEWLVRLRPGLPVMPANTALAFGLFAVAFAGVAQGSVRWCVLALLPAAFGAATFVQFAQGSSLGLDEWLVRHTLDPQPYPGRSAPVVAACFLLEGAVLSTLVFGQRFAWRAPALAVIGSVVTATGLAAVVGYLSRLPMAYTWGTDSPVALHTAVGLILLGVGTVVLATHDREPDAEPGARWLPYPVAIGFATMTLIFWTALNQREVDFQQSTLALTGNNIAFALNTEFEDQLKAAARIATREAVAPTASPRLRQIDAEVQARDFPAFRHFAWLGSDFRAQTVHPSAGFEHAVGYHHGVEPARKAAIERARLHRSATMTEPLQFELGGLGFAVYAPIYRGEQFVGLVAGEYRYREFVETLDRRLNLSSGYLFALSIQGETVYSTLPPPESRPARFRTFDETYTVQGQRVRVTVAALPGGRELPLTFNNVVLLSGFGIALLVGLVVNLTQKANQRRLSAEDTTRRLQQENYERRQVEAKLKLSEDRLNLALDSSQVGVFDWNVPTGKCHFSPGIWTLLGYQPGAMAPSLRSWDHLVHPDDRAQLRREFAPHSGHLFYESEYRVRTRGGEWLWVLERAKCVSFSPEGRPLRVTGTFQDISSRKQAEEALKASQAETRKLAIVASITDNLVVIADASGRIEWVNESFSRLLEFSLGEVVDQPVERFLFSRDLDPDNFARVQTAFRSQMPFTAEIVTAAKRGRRFHLHLELQPVFNEAGTVEKFIAVLYDITARIETERNLRTAKAQAEAATRAKSEFLASMSHEIRTPMNGVIALTSLLLESPLNHEQQDWVRTIRSSGDALLTIINDILDFSKIESGRMEIEQHPFDLANCIEEALELFALPAGGKRIELAYVLAEEVPSHVVGDSTRLRQVLVNLVGNAVKFTPAGSICIEVACGPGPDQIAFAITDTGIGIPADRQDALFQPFSQVDSSTTRRFGGTGLGLAICKRLVELMGGTISLASQPGIGTTFRFHINAPKAVGAPTAAEAAPSPPPASVSAPRVACVVDDNPVVRAFLARNLAAAHFKVYPAATPADATKLPADLAPALLFIDDSVPGGATTACATLRSHFGTVQPIVFLLCLAGQTPAPEQLAEMQVRGCLLKPLRQHALRERLEQLDQTLAGGGPAALPTVAEIPAGLAARIPLRILVAEDNPVNKKVALRLLERLGYRADAVSTGLEAVRALATTGYQLVFMDVQMPELDGIEATRRIRAEVAPERQPVIVALTANALHGDADRCRAAGMDDYITKPVRPEDIHQAILRHFDQSTPVAAGDN